ncbi:SRPBCC domain-containing protein [Teredinibacter sp. KSP-S5-2]|uniref:SRPBCC family protein n=1 Tax=Teredinibacter sp. KSP-S5-2 TaxID=3034506 RepID=UPI002934810F|nr:SRPBCC domain-containing protein [Teredinibacter sp. KSP-S5-2]WNO10795.1 SRPBCC domain-containing protein [Teredinibacter sp. KSP-S5-2]
MTTNNNKNVEPTILTRDYQAPIQLVYEAWTQVEHLAKWMMPQAGFECEYTRSDIRAGGSTLHKMTSPDGHQMWLLTEYEALTPPTCIVFRQYMSNQLGDKLSNPQMPGWPKELRTTVELTEIADNQTRLTLTWQPMNATDVEIKVFNASRPHHGKGWGAGLEQLGKYLSR